MIFSIVASMFLSLTSPIAVSASRNDACKLMQGAAAQSSICQDGGSIKTDIAPRIINWLIMITGALSVILIIYAGILYVVSAGDSGKAKKAKNVMIAAIVGLLITVFASVIVNLILSRIKS